MFYVYEWYIVDTNEIIYVGKGTNRRYKVRKHNSLFNEMIKRFPCESRIIKTFESEKDAFQYEYQRTTELKSIGQCVCNIAKAGSGGTAERWTDEMRKEYSEKNVMKSEAQRERMSKKNPMKDPKIAKKTNDQKKRPLIIAGVEYESVNEAKKKTGHSFDAIHNWCKRGCDTEGNSCYYKDSYIPLEKADHFKKQGKPIIIDNVRYPSVKEAAKSLGHTEGTISSWLKRGFSPSAIPCRCEGDNSEKVFCNRYSLRNKNRGKRVIVNGISYKNCDEAAETLGIKKSTLYAFLNGYRKSEKYKCKYDNQQPSRRNTEKSTAEGSETNG